MKTIAVFAILLLVMLPVARANSQPDCALDISRLVAHPVNLVPAAATLTVNGVKHAVHAVTSLGPNMSRQAAHTPKMAVRAGSKGASTAKAKATEGVISFNTISGFFLRIASSSFWALVSGILRF